MRYKRKPDEHVKSIHLSFRFLVCARSVTGEAFSQTFGGMTLPPDRVECLTATTGSVVDLMDHDTVDRTTTKEYGSFNEALPFKLEVRPSGNSHRMPR